MPTRNVRREFAKRVIDREIRQARDATESPKEKRRFAELLWNVQGRSALLRPACWAGQVAAEPVAHLLRGLVALVGHHNQRVRPIETWEPGETSPVPLFSSLAHHLFANYPVPPVLLSSWFRGTNWAARRAQGWFKHAGLGKSLRSAGFPIRLTRRMAHEFAQAPANRAIEFSLRWAQVRGLGGSDALAQTVASGRLGRWFGEEEFWTSAIYLFINTPRLDLGHVDPIVEYLFEQKCGYQQVVLGEDTEAYLGPPQPELSLKGRTVASLLRQAKEWAAERPVQPQRRLLRWQRSAIGEYRLELDDGRVWTIRELLDSNELAAEGKAMEHCVATHYTEYCAERACTIWSMAIEGVEGRERRATIEVDPQTKRIVQAKASLNQEPDDDSRAVLAQWAGQEGLALGT
jgi:hypothetical protein